MNKELKNRIDLYTNEVAAILLEGALTENKEITIKNKIRDGIINVIDEIISSDIILNTQNMCVVDKKGVSMQFEEIVKWWQSLKIQTAEDLEMALDNFKIVFACNSNSIEGNPMSYHTTREVFEGNSLSAFSGTARDIFEAQNQKFSFEFLMNAFRDELDIDLNFIKKLHNLLMYGCYDEARWKKGERPGKFKKGDYCVGTAGVGSFPDEVEEHLQELIDEMNDNEISTKEDAILIKAAYFHVVFETIHPFADGNGRVGRTLMNYYLMKNNYPPIVIFNEDKETYYLALEVFNKTQKLSGFVKFLKEQMVKTWESKIRDRNNVNGTGIKKLEAFF